MPSILAAQLLRLRQRSCSLTLQTTLQGEQPKSPHTTGWMFPSGPPLNLSDNWKQINVGIHDSTSESTTIADVRSLRSLVLKAKAINKVVIRNMTDIHEANEWLMLLSLLNTCTLRPDLDLELQLGYRSRFQDAGATPFVLDLDGQLKYDTRQDQYRQSRNLLSRMAKTLFGPLKLIFKVIKPDAIPEHTLHSEYPLIPRASSVVVAFPLFQPQITSLSISGMPPFSALLYPWTREVLNTSPLESLSIHDVKLNLYCWSKILSEMNIPTLKRLTIGEANIAFVDLAKFFICHPTIEYVDLHRNTLIGTTDPTFPKPFLPRLKELTATVEYVLPFLRQQRDRGHFEQLRVLNLRHIIYMRDRTYATMDGEFIHLRPQLMPVFDFLSKCRSQVFGISVWSLESSGLIEWFIRSQSERSSGEEVGKLLNVQCLRFLDRDSPSLSQNALETLKGAGFAFTTSSKAMDQTEEDGQSFARHFIRHIFPNLHQGEIPQSRSMCRLGVCLER